MRLLAVDWRTTHSFCDPAHADARMIPDHTEGPDLRTAQSSLLFHLLEMRAHCVEHHAETTQDTGRAGGIDGVLNGRIHDGTNQKKRSPEGS